MSSMRIGHGFDVHKFESGRLLIIGGVEIPYEKGLAGHSDADVLIHAIADAILGASGLEDIGQHFPPSDEQFKDADSMELLKIVMQKCYSAGMDKIENIDCVIMAEEPKMNRHIPEMKKKLETLLGLYPNQIGIKATTTEGLGFTGRKEGIAASAVCLITVGD